MPATLPCIANVTSAQHEPIDTLLRSAFGGPAEAELTARLRQDGDVVLELAAREGASSSAPVIGHILFSRLHVGDSNAPGIALAPLAVARSAQRRGIGGDLVRAGLARLKAAGESVVFVLGEPAYYRRFGFESDLAAAYAAPWSGSAFQALALGSPPTPAMLRYAGAFGAPADGGGGCRDQERNR